MLVALTLLMALPGLSTIPVIDRDEARYAQSSVQMVESGDYVEIRLGERARNKKPVGAYWAQAGAILATGGLQDQPGQTLWAQRLPSVIAGVIAVLLTYLAAIHIVGQRGALLAGAMLATSLIFVFEAHIAKTDALLLASTTAVFAALVRLRANRPRGMAALFWTGLALAVLIKGPVGPAVAVLALIGLFAWERRAGWAKPLLNPFAIALFALIVLPWAVAIYLATNGQFFADALGGDFGGKLAGAAENHGGPPGYYLATILVSLWPASLFLLPGAVFAWQAARRGGDSLPARGMRLCLAWIVPFWVVLEVVPTKLIHYPLPLFPALCIAMAGAALAILGGGAYTRTRWVSGVLFIVSSAVIIGVVLSVHVSQGQTARDTLAFVVAAVAGVLALAASICLFRARIRGAAISAGVAAVLLSVTTYAALIPPVKSGRLSQLVAGSPAPILSPDYDEASLRYYAGTDAVFGGDDAEWEDFERWTNGTLVVDARRRPQGVAEAEAAAQEAGICLAVIGVVEGLNYSRAEPVELTMLRQRPC